MKRHSSIDGEGSTGVATASTGLRGWLPHIALVLVAALMVLVGRARHTATEDALRTAFDPTADADERIWAMHLIANRATEVDPRLGVDLVESFLSSESDKVREAAHLIDLCRHAIQPPGAPAGAAPPIQDGYAYGSLPGDVWTPHRIRCLVLHRRKVGGSAVGGIRRMELAEAEWFLDSLAGKRSPSKKEVQRYFNERARKAGAAVGPRESSDD
ncbi:hypothetical protein Poly30_30880 [Planctomycetes bacterium Poly30]|uniref:Uncharacterized protein n=1 Tax=Saltatorellus ferox TaxID=2528018 RepID=A0A518EU06_9BACT|nr:hypothetical protein Poly30_30880 [Planctomycetes bacterium Poly30]